ncbi:MAG: murein biosynthesis integral membrane protein MurJ, partial [Chloroflexota bacterium]
SELDAYNAAFVIPEVLFDVIVAAGLAAPFVPIFIKVAREDERDAAEFARTVLTLAVIAMAGISLVLFATAPATVELVAPRFGAEQRALYTGLFRVMCVTPVIFAAALVLGEVLVARRSFLFYGVAPLLYNGGIVFGTAFLAGRFGIFGPAIGAVIGALLYFGVRLVGCVRAGFAVRPAFAIRTVALREFVRLMLPRMASAPIEPITFQFFTSVASGLAAGSISSISFARNFQSVPVSLIAIAFSLAVFPALSDAAAKGDRTAFVRLLRTNVVVVGGLLLVAAAGLLVLSEPLIATLLGGGAFDREDVQRTALVLAVFAISVPLEGLTYPLARAIYATRNTVLPVTASIVGFALTIAATLALEPSLGVVAVPLGFSIGSGAKLALLAVFVPFRIRRIPALAFVDLSQPDGSPGSSAPRR